MTAAEDANSIWNRAAVEDGGKSPGPGDVALASVLRFHSLAMSGGVLDAVERLSAEPLRKAMDGFRWLGLSDAAAFLVGADERWTSSGKTLEEAEILEAEFDAAYSTVVPDDETIVSAFEDRFRREPASFAAPE